MAIKTMFPLDLTGYRVAEAQDQPQPSLIWAEVDDLVIDRAYQRLITPAGRRAIQKIADEFDWTKFEPILVAPAEGGKLAIVDGQHRAHGAAAAGYTRVPAMSVAMTPKQQAAGFAAVNRDRIRMSLHQIYRAELAAGAEWAEACRDVVAAAGCTLATSNSSARAKRPRVVYAVGLVRRMVAAGEGGAVTAGLDACVRSGMAADPEVYGGGFLRVWLGALATNQRFLRMDLPRFLDRFDMFSIIDEAFARAKRTGQTGVTTAIEVVVAHLRNDLAAAA